MQEFPPAAVMPIRVPGRRRFRENVVTVIEGPGISRRAAFLLRAGCKLEDAPRQPDKCEEGQACAADVPIFNAG